MEWYDFSQNKKRRVTFIIAGNTIGQKPERYSGKIWALKR